jgi:hypothetical protein
VDHHRLADGIVGVGAVEVDREVAGQGRDGGVDVHGLGRAVLAAVDAAVVGDLERLLAVTHAHLGGEHTALDALVGELDVADPLDPTGDPLERGPVGRGGLEHGEELLLGRHEAGQGAGRVREVVADVDVDPADALAAGVEGDRGRAVLRQGPLGREVLGQRVEADVGDQRRRAGLVAGRLEVHADVGPAAIAVGREGDVAAVAAAVADVDGDLAGQPLDLGVEVELAVGVDHVDVGGEVDLARGAVGVGEVLAGGIVGVGELETVGERREAEAEVDGRRAGLDLTDDPQRAVVADRLPRQRAGVDGGAQGVEQLGQAPEDGLERGRDRAARAGLVAEPDVGVGAAAAEVDQPELGLDPQRGVGLAQQRRGEQPVDLHVGLEDRRRVRRVAEDPADLDEVHRHGDVGEQVTVDVDGDRHLGQAGLAQGQVEEAGGVAVRRRHDLVDGRRERERLSRVGAEPQQQGGGAQQEQQPGGDEGRAATVHGVAGLPHHSGGGRFGAVTERPTVLAVGTSRASGSDAVIDVANVQPRTMSWHGGPSRASW